MYASIVQPFRRALPWCGLLCLIILVSALLAACGGSTGTSDANSSTNNANASSTDTTNSGNPVSGVSTAGSIGTASSVGTASSIGTAGSVGTAGSIGTASTGNTTGGMGTATTDKPMITIKENKGVDQKNVYIFDPETLTVKKGDTVTIQNSSDKLQTIDQGDATQAGINASVSPDKSEMVTFNKAGTFTLRSSTGATITVTVQDTSTP